MRCALVSGVQTCALPISELGERVAPFQGADLGPPCDHARRLALRDVLVAQAVALPLVPDLVQDPLPLRDRQGISALEFQRAEDQKSVVSGKRVSVRVDIGGSRNIKKKKKKNQKKQ